MLPPGFCFVSKPVSDRVSKTPTTHTNNCGVLATESMINCNRKPFHEIVAESDSVRSSVLNQLGVSGLLWRRIGVPNDFPAVFNLDDFIDTQRRRT
jgi:hypothetical protein